MGMEGLRRLMQRVVKNDVVESLRGGRRKGERRERGVRREVARVWKRGRMAEGLRTRRTISEV